MGVEHLQGKRTGRRPGSKSVPPWVRDLRWAYQHLGEDIPPPSELARCLVALGRKEPDRFLACLAMLDARPSRAEPRAMGPSEQHGPVVGGLPEDGRPRRLKRMIIPEVHLFLYLRGQSAPRVPSLPHDVQVVGCEVSAARKGILITLRSETFPVIPDETPIPEFQQE